MNPTIGPRLDQLSILQFVNQRPAQPLPALDPKLLQKIAEVCRTIGTDLSLACEGQRRITVQRLCDHAEEVIDDPRVQTLRVPIASLKYYQTFSLGAATFVIVSFGTATLVSVRARSNIQALSRLLISSLRALTTPNARERYVREQSESDSPSLRFTPVTSPNDSDEIEGSTVSTRSRKEKAPTVSPLKKRKRSASADGERDSPERASKRRKPCPYDRDNEQDHNSDPEKGAEGEQGQCKGKDEEDEQGSSEHIGKGQVKGGKAAKREGRRERKTKENTKGKDALEESVKGAEAEEKGDDNVVGGTGSKTAAQISVSSASWWGRTKRFSTSIPWLR